MDFSSDIEKAMPKCTGINKKGHKVESRCDKGICKWKQHNFNEFHRNMAKEGNQRWENTKILNI